MTFNRTHTMNTRSRRLLSAGLLLAGLTFCGGCAALGVLASKMPQPPTPAQYVLAGHSVGVMVWADRGLIIDWPQIQLDLAGGVQERLKVAQEAKKKDLLDVTFPVLPASIIKWQRDNPTLENAPVIDIAPRLGVNRLIYIEVSRFGTRAAELFALYRGSATATIKVVDVAPDGTASVAWESGDIEVAYPKTAPAEGTTKGNDRAMYVGTIQTLADVVAVKFIEHSPDE
jgi:hypothetical protein